MTEVAGEGPTGLLLVDKPEGLTSHDVVDVVRRAYGQRSVGHLGTLDPFATGLLVVLLGRSTRLSTFIENEPKVYDATIAFGAETDTDDRTGAVVREAPAPAADAAIVATRAFVGTIAQTPPAFSAKKVDGRAAYHAAREGEPIELAPVDVIVHAWDVLACDGATMRARITCGGGTYIRALARDLGRALGSAAHLTTLRRERSGAFEVADAHSLDALRASPPPPLRRLRVVAE